MKDIQKNGFPVESTWVSIQNAVIQNDTIGFIDTPKAKLYDPFDYYYNPVPEEIISDILGTRNNLQNITLYTLFASLDPLNDEQILKWVYHFGIPIEFNPYPPNNPNSKLFEKNELLSGENFLYCDDGDEDQYSNNYRQLAYRFRIKNEIYSFKFVTKVISEQKKGNIPHFSSNDSNTFTRTKSFLKTLHQSQELLLWGKRHLRMLTSELLISSDGDISYILDEYLKNIYPSLVFKNGAFSFSWNFSTLLSALYFMLALDLVENKIPIECQNPLCRRFFIPNKTGAIYCSDTCQNRAKQQRHRAKVKKVKEGEENAVKD